MSFDKNKTMKQTQAKAIDTSKLEIARSGNVQPQPKRQYKPVRCNFYTSHDLFIALDTLAKFEGTTRAKLFNKIMEQYINTDDAQSKIKLQNQIDKMKEGK